MSNPYTQDCPRREAAEKAELEALICRLRDPDERAVVRMRYFDREGWRGGDNMENISPCALMGSRAKCVALNQKHPNCPTTECPFYITAVKKAKAEAAAQERCKRRGIPYGEEYAKMAERGNN